MKNVVTIAAATLLLFTGCATQSAMKLTRPQPGQHALIVFKITHQDRAGESGTVIRKTGEIVSIRRGQVLIAGDEGDILRCPAKELHAITPEMAVLFSKRKQRAPDYVAAEELERWFPAQDVPFTVRWLSPEEIAQTLRSWKP
jgi:hypothetical protein